MLLAPYRFALVLVFPLFIAVLDGVKTRAEEESSPIDSIVAELSDAAFLHRQRAFGRLVQLATDPNTAQATEAQRAIRNGRRHRSAEVRLACREIEKEIWQLQIDEQTRVLLDSRCDPGLITARLWPRFAALAGTDMDARRLFAKIHDRYPRLISNLADDDAIHPSLHRMLSEPVRLQSYDACQWGTLLLTHLESTTLPDRFGARIVSEFCQPAHGPRLGSDADSKVLRRIIQAWIHSETHWVHFPADQRLRIALKYDFASIASELSCQILDDETSSARSLCASLLAAGVLQPTDFQSRVTSHLHDDRDTQTWRLIASRQTRIRSQVRDVALAVLLHHHQIDPRSVGFEYLEADCWLRFREDSLGFPDQRSRRLTHDRAMLELRRKVTSME